MTKKPRNGRIVVQIRRYDFRGIMEKKTRAEKDKRYEEKHKAERKAAHIVWGTSVERQYAEEINMFLKEHRISKVELIKAGFEALQREYGPQKKE